MGLILWMYIIMWVGCSTGWAAGSLWWLRVTRAPFSGNYKIGTLRGRLPAGGDRTCGLNAQLHYPIADDAEKFEDQWFSLWRYPVRERYFAGEHCLGEALLGDEKRGPMDPQKMPMASPDGGWPIVLFSSGLYGALEYYQQFCRDMASTGVIVIAVEHEDGAGTYATDCDGTEIFYKKPVIGVDNNTLEFRRPQLEMRNAEYNATVLGIQHAVGDEASGPNAIETVLRTGNVDKMILTGHSFGGCSSFYYMSSLAQEGIPTPFIGSILLDQWTAPLTWEDYATPIQEPVVFMTSDKWRYSSKNITNITNVNSDNTLAAVQVVGTTHDWISEDHLLAQPWFARRFINGGIQMGPADYVTAFSGTMQAVKDSLAAFVNPTLRAGLSDKILAIDPNVVKPMWDGN